MANVRRVTHRLAPVAVGTGLVLYFGAVGVTYAATGGTFLLGNANSATTVTKLTNSKGTALSLVSKKGTPPLTVSNSTKVARLNADLLDGTSVGSLQHRVSGTCAKGAISSVRAGSGVTCSGVTVYSATAAGNVLLDTKGTQSLNPGVDTNVLTLSLPAGTWLVDAHVDTVNFDDSGDFFRCGLQVPNGSGGTTQVGWVTSTPGGQQGPVTGMQPGGVVTLTAPGDVVVLCNHDGDLTVQPYAEGQRITALRVDSLNP